MDRFLIAPFNSGLVENLKPFLIPDDAFTTLENAYIWRGRVKKRFGEELTGNGAPSNQMAPLYSRLAYAIPGGSGVGTTSGAGFATGTIPISFTQKGQMFSIGSVIYTVVFNGAGAMLKSGATTSALYNNITGTYTFVGAPINTQIYFYPALPVMTLANYEVTPINNQPTWAFDPSFAYVYTGSRWLQSGRAQWHGDETNFYWWSNYDGIVPGQTSMFVSNFHAHIGLGLATDDPIWTYNIASSPPWNPFSYSPDATINPTNVQPLTVTTTTKGSPTLISNFVQTALIVLPFKDRLILLNTIENNANGTTTFVKATPTITGITPTTYLTSTNTQFVNRCRYSWNGSPFDPRAWLETNQVYQTDSLSTVQNAAGGGFIDAPTEEAIVSAEFIKDRLIVYFENSTWELAYTGNQELPFDWQKINTEFGAESPFATVPFDKVILTFATNGITACSGANVERIDQDIPDEVFAVKSKQMGAGRVVGIRDYDTEMVYWSYPEYSAVATIFYPNRVFVYNYKTGSWAFNDDCITCFGYFEQQSDLIWENATFTWEQAGTQTWISGILQADHRRVISGNQEGFVFIIDPEMAENAPVMSITNMIQNPTPPINVLNLTVMDHSLNVGDYVQLLNASGSSIVSTRDPAYYYNIYEVIDTPDEDTILIGFTGDDTILVGTYSGGGTLTRVSNLTIQSKEWNPYLDQGANFHLSKIDFGVQRTSGGQVTISYFPSSSSVNVLAAGIGNNSALGTGILETKPYDIALAPLEQAQDRLWHPVYFQTIGNSIQIKITMSDKQMTVPLVSQSDFEIEGMILHTQRVSNRIY